MLHKFIVASRINAGHLPSRSLLRFVNLKKCPVCATVLFGLLALATAHAQTPLPSPSPAPTPITKTGNILVNSGSTVGRISKWVTSSSNGTGTIGDSVITESAIGTIGIGTNPFSDFKLAVDGGTSGGLFVRTINSYGIFAQSTSMNAVNGESSTGIGVRGLSNSGPGVLGQSESSNGVFGFSNSGIAVAGQSQSNTGVLGHSNSGTGVFGQSNTGLAGFFQGRVNVTGLLSTGNLSLNPGGNFQFADGTIQTTAATITGVTAGMGLTGGGTVGNVTLEIANGAVGTTQIANDAIQTQNLANASVTSNKIASGQVVKNLNGLTDAVNLAAGANVNIEQSGNTLTISASGASSQPTYNPLQVAQLRWWGANQSGASFPVGNQPSWVTFDGSNMWVANVVDGTVSKIRASDGASLGTFPVGAGPGAVAFDGKNIWVANFGMNSNTVTKLNAATGETVDTLVVGGRPFGLAFDGTYMWVSCYQSNTVVKVRASDNQIVGSVSVASPLGLAFDGTNIWAALNLSSGRAAKISGSGSPTVLGEFAVGVWPFFVTFDGTNV